MNDELRTRRWQLANHDQPAAYDDAPDGYYENDGAAGLTPEARKYAEAHPYRPPEDTHEHDPEQEMHRGQLRLAERFAIEHGNTLRHAHGIGWLRWDGTRWAPDRDGQAVRAAVATIKNALADLVQVDDKKARKDLLADINRVESANGLQGILTIAGNLHPLAIGPDRLDPDPYLFNTTNGTLDLRTSQLRAHDPADLITKVAGCEYDANAGGPNFEKFLAEILPELEVRQFVQRIIGSAMLGIVREHVLPIFTGSGFNGKGTLLDLTRNTFGDYAIEAEPELLVDRGRNSTHPTGQADLLGVRLAVTSETDEGRKLATATVKRLTGGDTIRARKMRSDFFEFDPSHTLVMMTNHKPKVTGDDPAIWLRILVVPFDVVFDNPDLTLPERLTLERPAVLAWALDGYLDYTARGLDPPVVVRDRTNAYRISSDALGRYLDEHTIKTAQVGYARARELYSAWAAWCHETGEEPGSENTFSEAMVRRGYEKNRRAIGNVYVGLVMAAEGTDGDDDDRD
jgi:putative DNA primase/helicase